MTSLSRHPVVALGTTGVGLTALAATGVLGAGSAAGAAAHSGLPAHRAGVAFSFAASHIENGSRPVVRYSVSGVPRHGRVLLQRTHGHRYATVAKLAKHGAHSYTAPAVAQGAYAYRILVLSKSGRILAKVSHTLYSYAPVTLATFLGDSSETVQINGQEFRYIDEAGNNRGEIFKVNSSSCDAILLNVGADDQNSYYGHDTSPATISVVQENADEQSFNVSAEGTASDLVGLAHGAWEVDTAGDDQFDVFVNATLSCYTPSGSPDFY